MLKRSLLILSATLGLTGCQLIQDQLDGNQPPTVGEFSAAPAEGNAPLLVGFSWEIADLEGDTLSCTLVYGSQKRRVEDCGQVTDTFYTFEEPGGYAVVLTVDDGMNRAATSVAVRVLEAVVTAPSTAKAQKRPLH